MNLYFSFDKVNSEKINLLGMINENSQSEKFSGKKMNQKKHESISPTFTQLR